MPYKFNPFTNRLDYYETGGGGGGDLSTITPNSGGPVSAVSDNINDQGIAANLGGNAFPLFSYNGGAGQLNWENRTFLSPYVVDTNTTIGAKGTFFTLASAITQAIADGATGNAGITIFVRNCTINENITISTNGIILFIVGVNVGGQVANTGLGLPQYTGSFTNSSSAQITFTNFDFTPTSVITNSGTGITTLQDGNGAGTLVCSNANGVLECNNFQLQTAALNISHGSFNFYYAGISGGTFTFSNDASINVFYAGSFSCSLTGSTSSTLNFINCFIDIPSNTMTSGTLQFSGCRFDNTNIFALNNNVNYRNLTSQMGNTVISIRIAANFSAFNTDQYIGVINNSSQRTITLPVTNVIKDQTFIIKDEAGTAGSVNSILVTVSGGIKTIDGLTTFPININYGSISVVYDGINYFTF